MATKSKTKIAAAEQRRQDFHDKVFASPEVQSLSTRMAAARQRQAERKAVAAKILSKPRR